MKNHKNDKTYNEYKKWFIQNIILFIISIIILLYFVFLSNPTWLIIASILFTSMTISWGATAYTGMKENK